MEDEKINVLYIDDEEHNLVSFKATFRRIFNVYTADSAETGKNLLEEEDIQVILSDQRMPKMTGIEFFESIKDSHPNPIRILITGYTDVNAVIGAINRGQVYKYLTKPWVEEDVKNFVEKAYEVFKLRKDNIDLTKKLIEVNKKLEFLARQNLLS